MDLFFTNIAYARTVDSTIANINKLIINPLIFLMFGLALMYFLYGVFEFISNQENEEKKTAGKQHMIWGVIGLTIMIGVWFILGVIISTLGIKGIDPNANEIKDTVKLQDYSGGSPSIGN